MDGSGGLIANYMTIGFWPWGSGWMLLWSTAALAPIIIHLWSRRRRQETSWAAMRFLQMALQQHARRLRIERLLLLALRVLPLLIMGMALADPIAPWLAGTAPSTQQIHHVLVIDASYSMSYQDESSSFQRAKAAARDLISSARPGDGFTLVRMTHQAEILMESPTLDSQKALAEVDQLEISAEGANLLTTAVATSDLLKHLQEVSPHWQHQVIWLSDLTTSTWAEAQRGDCQKALKRINEIATMRLVDVGASADAKVGNTAITHTQLRAPLPIVDQLLTVEAVIRSYGHDVELEGTVTLSLDGEEINSRPLRIPPRGSQQVSMSFSVPDPGDHWVQLKLPQDSLAIDDQRHFCFRTRHHLRSLVVEGRAGAARRLALALRPTEDSPMQVDVASETALVERELNDYDCVFLSNVGRLGRNESRQLAQYVKNGGGLVVFLGDQIQADSYNEAKLDFQSYSNLRTARAALDSSKASQEPNAKMLFPATVGATMTTRQQLDPLDYQHPVVQVFAGHEQAGLRATPVNRYYQLRLRDDARPIVNLANGDVLIAERPFGEGRCVMVATAASPESTLVGPDGETSWNELPNWPSFLPLVQQMFLFVADDGAGKSAEDGMFRHNTLVGQPLAGRVRVGGPLELTTPKGHRHQLTASAYDQWTYDATSQPGLYRIQSVPSASAALTQLRAVNVDTSESDLAKLDPNLLPETLRLEAPAQLVGRATEQARLFRWFLAAVFVLLLIESWVSNRRLPREL